MHKPQISCSTHLFHCSHVPVTHASNPQNQPALHPAAPETTPFLFILLRFIICTYAPCTCMYGFCFVSSLRLVFPIWDRTANKVFILFMIITNCHSPVFPPHKLCHFLCQTFDQRFDVSHVITVPVLQLYMYWFECNFFPLCIALLPCLTTKLSRSQIWNPIVCKRKVPSVETTYAAAC